MTNNNNPAQAAAPSRIGIILAFAAVYTIWGSTYLAIRFAVEEIPPMMMAGSRVLVAGAFLFAILWLRGEKMPRRIHWRSAAIIGGLMLLGGTGGVAWSEQRDIPSGLVALMVAMVPLWMVIIDWLRPGGQRPGVLVLVGLTLGMIGLIFLIGRGDLADNSKLDPAGIIVMIISPILWALGSIYSRHAELPESPLMGVAQEMLMGGVLLLALALVMDEPARFDVGAITLRGLLAWVYLVTFGSLVAFSAYIWLLKVSTPARVGTYAYVNPVIAVLLGVATGEPLSGRIFLAGGIILLAVILVIRKQ